MTEAEEVGASGAGSNTMQALLQPTSEPGTSVTLCLPTRVFFPVKVGSHPLGRQCSTAAVAVSGWEAQYPCQAVEHSTSSTAASGLG